MYAERLIVMAAALLVVVRAGAMAVGAPDTVIINGRLVGYGAGQLPKEVKAMCIDVYSTTQSEYLAPIDSAGAFSVKFPAEYRQEIFIETGDALYSALVRPGEEYGFECQRGDVQARWSGRDSRILNEMALFRIDPQVDLNTLRPEMREGAVAARYAGMMHEIDSIARVNPSLSAEWRAVTERMAIDDLASALAGTWITTPDWVIPESLRSYIIGHLWPKLPGMPGDIMEGELLVTQSLTFFLQDWINTLLAASPCSVVVPISFRNRAYMEACVFPEAYALVRDDAQKLRAEVEAARRSGADCLPDSVAAWGRKLLARIIDINKEHRPESASDPDALYLMAEMDVLGASLDSIGASEMLRDACLSQYLYKWLDHERRPLPPGLEAMVDRRIGNAAVRGRLHGLSDKYRALADAQDATESPDKVPAERLAGLTSGKELIDSIAAPFRGQPVLIDVWGTWCSPCKAALAKFKEERQALAPYGVVYVFLANNSPEQSWRAVIADYDISGADVVHYNLPPDQQSAIEEWLQLKQYPTYVLIAPDGTMLDIDVDPRYDLAPLIDALRRTTGQSK